MPGRNCRWFARDAVASMGWWCLIIFAIGGCHSGVLAADSPAMAPNTAGARGEEGGCYRPLSDVLWGFLVTLLALVVSLWGSVKHINADAEDAAFTILFVIFSPLFDLELIVYNSLRCVSLLWKCHKMECPEAHIMSCSWFKFLGSSLFPWSKSPARILASCHVVVYVSTESVLLEKKWLWNSKCSVVDESEAMVVGENGARAIRKDRYVRKKLSEAGIGLMVWKEVFCAPQASKRLPKYDELKYLRGNSGFAVIAIAVQALGYIYAVGFRSAKNLRISPLEVIGLVFNIILLMKVFFYSTCNPCHRPLVIYLDIDWEHEIGEFDDNDQNKLEYCDLNKIEVVINYGIFVGLITLLIYSIVNIANATHVMIVLPLIAFLLGFILEFLGFQIVKFDVDKDSVRRVPFTAIRLGLSLMEVAYIWAIVGTVLYWRTMHFNERGDLINLSQIIPFIG